jgi:hypothetical protein
MDAREVVEHGVQVNRMLAVLNHMAARFLLMFTKRDILSPGIFPPLSQPQPPTSQNPRSPPSPPESLESPMPSLFLCPLCPFSDSPLHQIPLPPNFTIPPPPFFP